MPTLFPQVDPAFVGLEGHGIGIWVIAQDQLGTGEVETLGSLKFGLLPAEGAHHQELLPVILPGVDVKLFGTLVILLVIAVADAAELLAQMHCLAVEIQQGVGVCLLGGYIDFLVIVIHIEPGLACGEAGVFGTVPLHRGPGGVPGGAPHGLQPLFRGLFQIGVG